VPVPPLRVTVVELSVVLMLSEDGVDNVNAAAVALLETHAMDNAPFGWTVSCPLNVHEFPVAPLSVTVCCATVGIAEASARNAPATAIVRRRKFWTVEFMGLPFGWIPPSRRERNSISNPDDTANTSRAM
jgi:hypothetical protein